MDTVPDGAVIFFVPGIYILNDWSTYALRKSLTLVAHPGTVHLIGPATSDGFGFIDVQNSVVGTGISFTAQGLSFRNWGRTLLVTNSATIMERLTVRECDFDTVLMAVNGYGGPVGDLSGNRKIKLICIDRCSIRNTLSTAIVITSWFDEALVTGNSISNIQGSAISIGNTAPGYGPADDQWRKAIITENRCSDLSLTASGTDVHGIICGGREIIVAHNHIENVDNGGGTGAEGIYLKARYSDVSHNILVNAGRKEAAITLKGDPRNGASNSYARGFANRITDNVILNTRSGDYRGIMTFCADTLVAGNYLEGVYWGIRVVDLDAAGNFTIEGNVLRDVALGIKVDNASRVTIRNNTVSVKGLQSTQAIYLTSAQNQVIVDWILDGNFLSSTVPPVSNLAGIFVDPPMNGVSGLHISGNHISDFERAIQVDNAGRVSSAWIRHNYLRGCTQGIVLSPPNPSIGLLDNRSS